ncbi:hypothetical protein AB0I27_22755 [Streptomyces sp. NPDC050597]|uniref:hypothetical protein n=1 Tax=Streptomyces sp. NPDC050597 TaxID=3157212 RepID=UPI00341DD378
MASNSEQQIAAYQQGATATRDFQARMLAAGDTDTAKAASDLTDGYLDAINNTQNQT